MPNALPIACCMFYEQSASLGVAIFQGYKLSCHFFNHTRKLWCPKKVCPRLSNFSNLICRRRLGQILWALCYGRFSASPLTLHDMFQSWACIQVALLAIAIGVSPPYKVCEGVLSLRHRQLYHYGGRIREALPDLRVFFLFFEAVAKTNFFSQR